MARFQDLVGGEFIREKLQELSEQRSELEVSIADVDTLLSRLEGKSVSIDTIRQALSRIDEVYVQLQPFEKRELIASVVKRASVSEREITIEFYWLEKAQIDKSVNDKGEMVRAGLIWLPE